MLSDIEAIRKLVGRLNQAWIRGNPEEIGPMLDNDVIFVQPAFTGRLQGRAEAVASYARFLSQARIHDAKLGEPTIDVFGDTAIATYRFDVDYELSSGRFRETGRDVFVLTCSSEGIWRVVWRMVLSDAEIASAPS